MIEKEININERREIQLEMLDEFHTFCISHDLKYSLAYGTLLGAIRHKGFIPWDDDVDIMMPSYDIIRFKELFRSNNIKYIDVDADKNYEWSFPRLAYNRTYYKEGLVIKRYGVNIDFYAIVGLPSNKNEIDDFLQYGSRLAEKCNKYIIWRSRVIRRLPVKSILGFSKQIRKLRDFAWQYPYDNSRNYYSCAGEFSKIQVLDFDMFSKLESVDFNGHQYLIISEYDRYLKQMYGDYMKLPPEEERVPYHGGSYYWLE